MGLSLLLPPEGEAGWGQGQGYNAVLLNRSVLIAFTSVGGGI